MQVVKADRGNYSTDHPPSELADLPSRSALQTQESSASSCPELQTSKARRATKRGSPATSAGGSAALKSAGVPWARRAEPPRPLPAAERQGRAEPRSGTAPRGERAGLRYAPLGAGQLRRAAARRSTARRSPAATRGTYRGPPWSGAGGEGAAARPSHRRRSEEVPHPLRPLPRPRHGHGTRDTAPGSSRPRLPPAAPPAEPGTGLPMPGRASPFRDPAGLCPQQGNCLFQLLQSHVP